MDPSSWNCEQLNVTKGVKNANIFVVSVGCIMYECLGIFQKENWSLFGCFRFREPKGSLKELQRNGRWRENAGAYQGDGLFMKQENPHIMERGQWGVVWVGISLYEYNAHCQQVSCCLVAQSDCSIPGLSLSNWGLKAKLDKRNKKTNKAVNKM